LFGQPELDDLLSRPDLRQLKQRIVFSEYLQTIPRKSLSGYINYRLKSAGYSGVNLFSRGALGLLYSASGGVPRLINVMSHKAMLAAYGQGSEKIGRRHMERAIVDTGESRSFGRWLARRDYWLWPSLAALVAVCVSIPVFLGVSL
jgi:MSHA biogenesis protein MshM